ncbi:class I glutamine amidotransferase-like protein, partial [Setomelanomma holmii]
LDEYIRSVYTHHPRVKIFGSCFGHQLICQSLLIEYGVRVEVDPNGWEIGVKEVTLHKNFLETFGTRWIALASPVGKRECGDKMRLQFVHHDRVVILTSDALPTTWTTFGSTTHCTVQGVYEPARILTLQGHFEFDRFINSECIIHFFGSTWDNEKLDDMLMAIDADDDSDVAAKMVLQFLLEGDEKRHHSSHAVMGAGGLLTPLSEG